MTRWRRNRERSEKAERPAGRTPRRIPSRSSRVSRHPRAAAHEGRSRLGDLTRPVAREHAITRRWSSNVVGAAVGLTVALALAAALFVLPVRTWFDQGNQIDRRQQQLEDLSAINAALQDEVDRLGTEDGIREASRDEIGYIDANEQRSTFLDYPNLPDNLPDGWPYSIVADIVDIRSRP